MQTFKTLEKEVFREKVVIIKIKKTRPLNNISPPLK